MRRSSAVHSTLGAVAMATLGCSPAAERPVTPQPPPTTTETPAPLAAVVRDDPRGAKLRARGKLAVVGRSRPLVFDVELARTEEERNRGLMFRRQLPEGTGMLFFMPRDYDWAFWMRNTWIPLDMIFLDRDLVVVGVVPNVQPLREELQRCGAPSRHVLELAAHEAERHGLRPGVRLELLPEQGATP